MRLSLYRTTLSPQSTIGKLFADGKQLSFTLELPTGRCIPAGMYAVELYASPDFQRLAKADPWFKPYCDAMPHVVGLPPPWSNPSIVMLHPGNLPSQTKGCILVGETQGVNCIGTSRDAFAKLYSLIQPALPDVSIAIFDAPAQPPLDVDLATQV